MTGLATAAVVAIRSDEPSISVAADEQPTTSTSTSTTEAPSEPAPPGRRRLLGDSTLGWELLAVDDNPDRCLELVVGPWVQGSLLCAAEPATRLIGDVTAVDTPIGRMVVAVVDPSVTSINPVVGLPGKAGPDRITSTISYAAAQAGAGAGGHLPELLLASGDNTIARVILPAKTGLIRPAEMTVVNTPPYGRWDGYRGAGYAGLFFGGNQEVGFYDGPGDTTCILYRRLGSRWEELLADACPARQPDRAVAFARLVPTPVDGPEKSYIVVAVTDRPVTGWRCELPGGAHCGGGTQVTPDPKGSGRIALTQFADMATPRGASRITLVLVNGTEEVARDEVDVPIDP